MSIPIPPATSGSSTSRCTTSAPHQRATPVTRMRRRFLATSLSLRRGLVRAFDDVALHLRDGARHDVEQRQLRLPQRPLELAQQRVEALHRLDRVPDVNIRGEWNLVELLAARPPIREVDEVV